MVKRLFVCAVLVLMMSLCAHAADNSRYVVLENIEGEGRNREEAIQSAWLAGIREAVGSFIDSKTELNNDQLTERIIAYNRGLVERYEITGVDDSQAAQGIYKLTMKLWILRDVLRDGAKHVTAGSAEISFSPEDVKRRKEALDPQALEARNAAAETAKAKAQTGADLLSAMLERYKPEEFLMCYISGKPEPVKDKTDMFRLNVEVNFNAKLYKDSFVPDLEQVLNQIAAVKKNVMLIKQKTQLRNLSSNKGIGARVSSIIFEADGLNGPDYSIAVYDKPERFGVRLYGFKQEDAEKINAVLKKFAASTQRVRGLLLELQDEDRETLETIETPLTLKFLLSENTGDWAVHNTVIRKNGNYSSESLKIVVPVDMELPEEVLPYVKFFKVSLMMSEFPAAWLGIGLANSGNTKGAIITSMTSDAPAKSYGLQVGNVITAIDGRSVSNANEAIRIIGQYHAGDSVTITLGNGTKRLVTFGAKP